MRRRFLLLLLLLCLGTALACLPTPLSAPTPLPTPTPVPPTATLPPGTSVPPPSPTPWDTGWQPVVAGLERRELSAPTSYGQEAVTVVRLEPARFDLQVRYTPGLAKPLSGWAVSTKALLVVNAGYFTPEKFVTALTVSEGLAYGTPLGDYAGMLAVTPEGWATVRWLRAWPYDPAEPLTAAVQSFPVLVKPGGIMGFPADADEGLPARRTVVAQDGSGRLLFIVGAGGRFSLHELAVWLTESDLDVDIALNLDGGSSTGLWLRSPAHPVRIESFGELPAVITVEERQP